MPERLSTVAWAQRTLCLHALGGVQNYSAHAGIQSQRLPTSWILPAQHDVRVGGVWRWFRGLTHFCLPQLVQSEQRTMYKSKQRIAGSTSSQCQTHRATEPNRPLSSAVHVRMFDMIIALRRLHIRQQNGSRPKGNVAQLWPKLECVVLVVFSCLACTVCVCVCACVCTILYVVSSPLTADFGLGDSSLFPC